MPMRSIVANMQGSTWKYNWTLGDVDELYDLEADPLEMRSLVEHPDHQDLRSEIGARLRDWMQETSDIVEMERGGGPVRSSCM